jgi:hypothetical protein
LTLDPIHVGSSSAGALAEYQFIIPSNVSLVAASHRFFLACFWLMVRSKSMPPRRNAKSEITFEGSNKHQGIEPRP